MRILFLTNFYSPYELGGYEQWCREVADALRKRGHVVAVLTSVHGVGEKSIEEGYIYRLLTLESDLRYYRPLQFFFSRRKREDENVAHLQRVVADFRPDIVFVWGMWNLSRTLPACAEKLKDVKVVYFLSNLWPSETDIHTEYWRQTGRQWYTRPFKKLLGQVALALLSWEGKPVSLKFEHPICVSASVRDNLVQAGIPIKHAHIIYGGTDVESFLQLRRADNVDDTHLSLVYAGQLGSHKGVHTAIQALAILARRYPDKDIKLTIIGSGHPAYENRLRDLVSREELDDRVIFYGRVSRQQMPKLLSRFDVLVFPSIWEEPFARMVLEGMAAGLVVVGTPTGGTKEILMEGQNGLIFAPEDADGLAAQIERLLVNPGLRRRLAENGRKIVVRQFTLDRMVNEIETFLFRVLYKEIGP